MQGDRITSRMGISSATEFTSMLFVGLALIPFVAFKVLSSFPYLLHKRTVLGRKGDSKVIAHRGSRNEGD